MARYLDKRGWCWRIFYSLTIVDLFVSSKNNGDTYPIFRLDIMTTTDGAAKALSLTVPFCKIAIGYRL